MSNNSNSTVPEDVPDMMSECPICMEQLFDEEGVARNGDVANMMCYHRYTIIASKKRAEHSTLTATGLDMELSMSKKEPSRKVGN